MNINEFGIGWKNKFKPIIEDIESIFPDVIIENIERYQGMFKISFSHLDKRVQYVLDCTAYKMERDSAKICENCGASGTRRKDIPQLSEIKCLCWACCAIEASSMEFHNSN